MCVPGGSERQVDGREEEITNCQTDDKGGGGMTSQFLAPQQCNYCQQISYKQLDFYNHFIT